MEEHVYRIRSTAALLGKFKELEDQEIYFASPQELNDPMEGFKDVFWRGDEIPWTNLLRHYLLCLMQAVLIAIEHGPDHPLANHEIPVLLTEEGLAPSSRSIFQKICEEFFHHTELAELPSLLAARTSPIRRDELLSLFWFFHFHALKVACMAIGPQKPICLIDESLRAKEDTPFRFRHFFDAQNALDQKYKNSGDMVEQMSSEANSVLMQAILIRTYTGTLQHHGPAWNAISSAFPQAYVDQMEKLMYSDWYTACFVAEPRHAAMWGNYGDGHRGVCLTFRTRLNTGGKPSVVLRSIVGAANTHDTASPIYNDVHHELHEVQYSDKHVEIDFFRSMGKLTGPQLGFWFVNRKKEISPTGRDLIEGSEAWRRQYWSNFDKAITTKLSDWRHESEYRITFHSDFMDFSDKAPRKLRYRFEELQGIIFGMKTPLEDKVAMMHIIGSKCIQGRAKRL